MRTLEWRYTVVRGLLRIVVGLKRLLLVFHSILHEARPSATSLHSCSRTRLAQSLLHHVYEILTYKVPWLSSASTSRPDASRAPILFETETMWYKYGRVVAPLITCIYPRKAIEPSASITNIPLVDKINIHKTGFTPRGSLLFHRRYLNQSHVTRRSILDPNRRPGGRHASIDQGGPCPRLRRRSPSPKNRQQVDFSKRGETLEGHIGIVAFGVSRAPRQKRRPVHGFGADASAA